MTAEPHVDYDVVPPYWGSTDLVTNWMGTARFNLRPAPGGLALVQDFLNTEAQPRGFSDLLATASAARRWSARAVRAWTRDREVQVREPVLTGAGVAELRRLRSIVEGLVTRGAAAVSLGDCGEITLSLSGRGELCWLPSGGGWRWWSAAVYAEILASQHHGTWFRLKQCATATCRVVFYDRSWNNSAVLHSSTCASFAPRRYSLPSGDHQARACRNGHCP